MTIEMTKQHSDRSQLEKQLRKEVFNGQLLQLVMKLGCINERPEFHNDTRWAEHGDRYPLKLFRDYCFHQVDPNGDPIVDLRFIVSCLGKVSDR